MKRENGWMKVVIVILSLILAGLLGFVALDLTGKGGGEYRKVEVETKPEMAVGAGGENRQDQASAPEETQDAAQRRPDEGEGDSHNGTRPQENGPEMMEADGSTEPDTADGAAASPVTLLFAGDVLLSDHVLNAYDKAGGIHGVLDGGIRQEIEAADIFMANQEFPFSSRGTAVADKQYTFRLPPSRVNILQEMGLHLVTLANNHILDFGTDPLIDSGATLDQAGIAYVGAGENIDRAKRLVTMEAGGKTIGYLGASRVYMDAVWAATAGRPGVFSTYDPKQLVAEIKEAGDKCDYLVVYVHWGIERDTMPQDYQRTLAKAYIDAGADLVVGSHPHVLQGVEYYNGKPIVYSLGNFVFGSSIPKTALLKVELADDGSRLSLIPGTSSAGYTRLLEGQEQISEFYRYMTELSFGVTFDGEGTAVLGE